MRNDGRGAFLILVGIFILASWSHRSNASALEWIRQVGTQYSDVSFGVAADGVGNVYMTGTTGGSLAGSSFGAPGSDDAILYKFNQNGGVVWSRQLGTSAVDGGYSVATNSLGHVFVAGVTYGNMNGPSAGGADAFISKYDALGTALWTRQLGTAAADAGWGVAADDLGNVYIGGSTTGNLNGVNAGSHDGFVSKYNSAGNLQWTRQFGSTKEDVVNSISTDSLGNVYLSGTTSGSLSGASLGQSDAFVAKFDSQGNSQWTKQFGTIRSDNSLGVSADGQGNVYVTGYNSGDFSVPNPDYADVFLSKLDANGDAIWSRSLGSNVLDTAHSVSVDSAGNAFVAGRTAGGLGGPNAGLHDVFVSKYDPTGDLKWTRQFGTTADDIAYGVTADDLGNIFVSGSSFGDLGGEHQGFADVFVARIVDVAIRPADFNGDGSVDGIDLTQWKDDFGVNGDSDADGDGDSDGADFLAWQRAYGTSADAAVFAVPEPAVNLSLIAIAIAMTARRSSMRRLWRNALS